VRLAPATEQSSGLLVLAPLLFVVALVPAGCGGQDGSRTTPSRDRDRGTGAQTAKRAQTPASEAEPPSEKDSPGKTQSPVAGPTRATIMRRLDGRRIRVDHKSVKIDRQTLTCGRAGTTRASRHRTRIRLSCVQPTFPAGSVAGPDAIFFVHPTPAGRLVITNTHFTSY
jgi:hypothetical protein